MWFRDPLHANATALRACCMAAFDRPSIIVAAAINGCSLFGCLAAAQTEYFGTEKRCPDDCSMGVHLSLLLRCCSLFCIMVDCFNAVIAQVVIGLRVVCVWV